ncbi:TPA: MvdC/MvdD family ATP grasp protein [Clostridioides difficile]
MKKILIITSSVDYTVDYIITKYSNECKFYRVNVDKFDNYKFNISYDEGFCIINSQWRIGEDDIDAIYYRKPILPDLSKYEICYHKMISQDIISYINGIVDGFEKKY